jgi:hypothetical protein
MEPSEIFASLKALSNGGCITGKLICGTGPDNVLSSATAI